jgi:uncharacterized protein YdiU (UPF0061 family)
VLGEHLTPSYQRLDIQYKGSGRTPYSRRGDGRAALSPMLREYIISEAMHALGIPTSRSLAVVTTGEPVFRETILQGAILTRIASSHLRVGTFEYQATKRDYKGLKKLADYAIKRHYPELKQMQKPYLNLIKVVMERQVSLIVDWLRVGFIHGVMNTDNMSVAGETIDYGPCAFMDIYEPNTVFSAIDQTGRYSYANQPYIANWNIARFAGTLIPLLHDDIQKAAAIAEEMIQSFNALFRRKWLAMMRKKLGLFGEENQDEQLVEDLLKLMKQNQMDYTNTFLKLQINIGSANGAYSSHEFQNWWQRWQKRLVQNNKSIQTASDLMKANNPAIFPRNHKVEEALIAAEEHSDFSKFYALLKALSNPYTSESVFAEFQQLPEPNERIYQTFCGT